ncbi:hypothetical protein E2562_013756 [Oryza meyeriana var. granulata]|uniref:DUF834 domain-containing protein n=1 Tax=Oryza meyeriana var. granulata TaxID=110450 RepID=A0A6G1F814_9ORYZ|nr:hypothetical protein E2562_013756 [Oryza meyeriana var. granulata]
MERRGGDDVGSEMAREEVARQRGTVGRRRQRRRWNPDGARPRCSGGEARKGGRRGGAPATIVGVWAGGRVVTTQGSEDEA